MDRRWNSRSSHSALTSARTPGILGAVRSPEVNTMSFRVRKLWMVGALAIALIAFPATAQTPPRAAAAAGVQSPEYFLKIEGISGDSADAAHKEWIRVRGYSF